MTDIDRIKADIDALAARPKSVRFNEIERIVKQLEKLGLRVRMRPVTHGTLFTVESETFQVSSHNSGSGQVKPVYVKEFLSAMINLGLYE